MEYETAGQMKPSRNENKRSLGWGFEQAYKANEVDVEVRGEVEILVEPPDVAIFFHSGTIHSSACLGLPKPPELPHNESLTHRPFLICVFVFHPTTSLQLANRRQMNGNLGRRIQGAHKESSFIHSALPSQPPVFCIMTRLTPDIPSGDGRQADSRPVISFVRLNILKAQRH